VVSFKLCPHYPRAILQVRIGQEAGRAPSFGLGAEKKVPVRTANRSLLMTLVPGIARHVMRTQQKPAPFQADSSRVVRKTEEVSSRQMPIKQMLWECSELERMAQRTCLSAPPQWCLVIRSDVLIAAEWLRDRGRRVMKR
jgi:hypothetical protein